ncbi:MAG: hypothetical protein HQ521_07305 [Bacteroidetes bacterium]|nr:hypothetical protein [Bacteroidota bacterium]
MISKFENYNGQVIDLSNQNNGVYIIRIREKDFISTKGFLTLKV